MLRRPSAAQHSLASRCRTGRAHDVLADAADCTLRTSALVAGDLLPPGGLCCQGSWCLVPGPVLHGLALKTSLSPFASRPPPHTPPLQSMAAEFVGPWKRFLQWSGFTLHPDRIARYNGQAGLYRYPTPG